jgi:hypothetical protein
MAAKALRAQVLLRFAEHELRSSPYGANFLAPPEQTDLRSARPYLHSEAVHAQALLRKA